MDCYQHQGGQGRRQGAVGDLDKFQMEMWLKKYDPANKKSKFNFVVEYPIWVSIKRTLTGKLALAGENLIYCICLKENAPKPLRIAEI